MNFKALKIYLEKRLDIHTLQIRDGKLIVTRVYNLEHDEILLLRQREHNMSNDEFGMLCKL